MDMTRYTRHIHDRRQVVLSRARQLGFPLIACNGGLINDNESSWATQVHLAAPGVLDEIERRLDACEDAHAAGAKYREWEANFDRQRREEAEHARQYEAERIRRLLEGQ